MTSVSLEVVVGNRGNKGVNILGCDDATSHKLPFVYGIQAEGRTQEYVS